jgi:hypothetical protein
MSRLRASLSNSPLDREIQSHVAKAERALMQALLSCQIARKSDLYGQAYVARVRRDLEKALGATQSIRRVTPLYDSSDPDLLPTAPYEPPVTTPPEAPPEPVALEEEGAT